MKGTQQRITVTFLLAAVLVLLYSSSGSEHGQVSGSGQDAKAGSGFWPGQTFDASNSTWQDLEGRGLELASFTGKRVFVNYWATWCAPCIRELPSLARAASALSDDNTLFLFASDEAPDKIRDFIAERGFDGHFIKLNGYFGAHGIEAVPSSVLYDEQGRQLAFWPGAYEWDSEEMLAEIRSKR